MIKIVAIFRGRLCGAAHPKGGRAGTRGIPATAITMQKLKLILNFLINLIFTIGEYNAIISTYAYIFDEITWVI